MSIKASASVVLIVIMTSLLWGKTENLLKGDFSSFRTSSEAEQALFNAKNFAVKDALVPVDWQLNFVWKDTKGSLDISNSTLELAFPEDRWMLNYLENLQGIESAKLAPDADYYFGFTGAGNGAVRISIRYYAGEKFLRAQVCGDILLPQSAKNLRSNKFKLQVPPEADKAKLALGLYGKVIMDDLHFARQEPIDPNAELTFYLPFENSTQALFSKGSVLPLYTNDAPEYVPGKLGKAARYTRQVKFNPQHKWLQFPKGSRFNGNNILDPDNGCIEFYFRPLPEIADYPSFNCFYLFYMKGKGSNEFLLQRKDDQLELVYKENDSLIHSTNCQTQTSLTLDEKYILGKTKEQVNRWRHLALVYKQQERTIFLDGKKILAFKAKRGFVCSEFFSVAGLNHLGPFIPSSDMDEFKIFRGQRYHEDFIPEPISSGFHIVPASSKARFSEEATLVGKPVLALDGQQIIQQIQANGQFYQLIFALMDGSPYVMNSRNLKIGQQLINDQPEASKMNWTNFQEKKEGFVVESKPVRVQMRAELKQLNGRLQLKLHLQNLDEYRAHFELQLRLVSAEGQIWEQHFDGQSVRPVLSPFEAYVNSGELGIFPMTAASQGGAGMALALQAQVISAWLGSGMPAANTIQLGVRSVLDEQEKVSFAYDLFNFAADETLLNAVARYHRFYPEFFALNPGVHDGVYRNCADYLINWKNPAYLEKMKLGLFSEQEISRRSRGGWVWYYASAPTAGNWGIDEKLTRVFPNNYSRLGGDVFSRFFRQQRHKDFERMAQQQVSLNYYILDWAEQRIARYFQDSVISPWDNASGTAFIKKWYIAEPEIKDYLMMPYGTSYGQYFARQLTTILAQNQTIKGFAYDVAEGRHLFRSNCDFPQGAAYDEKGKYYSYLAAIAKVLEHIKSLKTGEGYIPSVIGNSKPANTSYADFFRMDSFIAEQKSLEYFDYQSELQLIQMMMGQKPNNLYMSLKSSLTGNYFPDVGKRDTHEIRLTKLAIRMQLLLKAFLYNLSLNSDLIFGVKEVVEAQDELWQCRRLGYNFLSPFAVNLPLQCAWYGKFERGLIPVVNPDLVKHDGLLHFNVGNKQKFPVLALNGQSSLIKVERRQSQLKLSNVPAMEYKLVSVLGNFNQLLADCRSTYESDGIESKLNLEFSAPENLFWSFQLLKEEELQTIFINGKAPLVESEGRLLRVAIPPGQTKMQASWKDMRWGISLEELRAIPLIDEESAAAIVCLDAELHEQAERLVEYFAFWSSNRDNNPLKLLVKVRDTPPPEDRPALVLKKNELHKIELNGKQVILSSSLEKMPDLLEIFMSFLDQKYPYYGIFGNQNINSFFTDATTGEQKALQEQADLIGTWWSWREILNEFQQKTYPLKKSGKEILRKRTVVKEMQVDK